MVSPALSPSEAAAELLKRRRARSSFLEFCCVALAPFGQTPARHHRLLIDELQAIASGQNDRLMVFMPPGSAKSTYASVLFPAWLLAQKPGLSIIGASNTDALAALFSRRIQAVVRDHRAELGYSLARESAELWTTSNNGQYRAAGVSTAIAGYRADCAILDDPIRSREEAESESQREKLWAWFSADLRSRLKPNASVVLIQTRWHQDDLGGRLLETQGDRWRVLSLPAVALENDPLGREPGELLWSDTPGYPYAGELARVRTDAEQNGGLRDWASLYQQSPAPAEGALFKVEQIGAIEAAPAGGSAVRAWDLAATRAVGTRNPDWTCGVRLHRLPDDRFVVSDVVRLRGDPADVERAIRSTAERDGKQVAIGIPQDPGAAGKSYVGYLTRRLMGFRVVSSPESGDKAQRAAPFASQVNVGNVLLQRGVWNRPYVDELAAFPGGAFDDQVDASSRAFGMLSTPRGPARRASIPFVGR